MPRKGANVSLSSYDDIFSTEQSRTEAGQEHVKEIPLEELHPFEGHPFKVLDNKEMDKTVESVRALGVAAVVIGGGVFAFMKLKGKKEQEKEKPDPDDEYQDEEDEDEEYLILDDFEDREEDEISDDEEDGQA